MEHVYFFGEGKNPGKKLLGNKGTNLFEMTRIGLPVPPGFTISSSVCVSLMERGKKPQGLEREVAASMKRMEAKTGKTFGSADNPLLVSIRSGSMFSMPGMMDTVLNLGLNDQTVKGLAKKSGNERFAWDCYRRLVQMFGDVVLGLGSEGFEEILESRKKGRNDTDLTPRELRDVVKGYRDLIIKKTGKDFPQDPLKQLSMAVDAVFLSWNNQRAKTYRKLNGLPDDAGTAVNVQAMVFGNTGWNSGTGVGFTRNPSTGEREKYGEFLLNAQGEDVVAGIRTPEAIAKMDRKLPKAFRELMGVYERLEKHYRDMQDFEFTIEEGRLFLLQTRTGKRTMHAAVKIAVDMFGEGLITKEEAIMRIDPNQLNQLLHENIDPSAPRKIFVNGLAASPGAGVGKVVFTAEDAVRLSEEGENVILVRKETSPDDIHGMAVSKGIVTARGGMTSHAAVVARGMGKPCIAGCEDLEVDYKQKIMKVGNRSVKEGEYITVDGTLGQVLIGKMKTVPPQLSGDFRKLMVWVDEKRRLGVRTNADTPKDAKTAREFGAEGIGLCRTEHMFFGEDRLPWMQKMILAKTAEERKEPLKKLLAMQTDDFYHLFREMKGFTVTIRLLDPPLHEFLPSHEELLVELTKLRERKADVKKIAERERTLKRIEELRETNPMMGNRGCRLGIVLPEVYEMQVEAIIKAACRHAREGNHVSPEIMIPLVSHKNELKILREMTDTVAAKTMKRAGAKVRYSVGTMIEIPRAALTADEIAEYADFFSFGTNDLTQMTFGFSRDDAEGKFLNIYVDKKIFEKNPFTTLDRDGVGKLAMIAIDLGRKRKPKLKIGICGEHGGDPSSIEFCHQAGFDYVSCSPFRIPIARLAAAQAAIKSGK